MTNASKGVGLRAWQAWLNGLQEKTPEQAMTLHRMLIPGPIRTAMVHILNRAEKATLPQRP